MKRIIYSMIAFSVFSAAFAQTESEDFDESEFFFEGEELVVEDNAERKAESGVSVVLTKEQMDTTARLGLSEDIMNSVATMPGVAFSGQWESEPSVRGGYPREMKISLDGVYLIYPWHWGGAYSIFNPNFVDSAKLNNGVFSARYGQAISGLLDVTSIKPEEFHFDFNISFLSTELFLQTPITDKGGLILFGKCTYLESLVGAYRLIGGTETDSLKRPPYIRDFYAKGFYKPTDKLEFVLKGFYGSDGMELDSEQTDKDSNITSHNKFDYDIYTAFASANVHWTPTDSLQFRGDVSYNFAKEKAWGWGTDTGDVKYTDEFVDAFPSLGLSKGSTFRLEQEDEFLEELTDHVIQFKSEGEYEFRENQKITFGAEEIINFQDIHEFIDVFSENNIAPAGEYPDFVLEKTRLDTNTDGNKIFSTAAYSIWNFGGKNDLLKGEIGLRYDQLYVRGKNGISLLSKPSIDPRVVVSVTPWHATDNFDNITFSVGSGLFSGASQDLFFLDNKKSIDGKIKQDRALLGVLGFEANMYNGIGFKLEAYYKHYLSRAYTVFNKVDGNGSHSSAEPKVYMNGEGRTLGCDLMIQKNKSDFLGKWWDGYLTYSFIYAKFKNPAKPADGDPNQTTRQGDPLDTWYYPSFHRFHSANLIINFKPSDTWTITLKGAFATGTPRTDGDKIMYYVRQEDGSYRQRYTRTSFYSDTLRTGFSCPIDIRIAHRGTFKRNPKLKWEWYIGAEDILTNLYAPEGSKQFNQNTGKDQDDNRSDFSIGIPLINFGYRISF